MDILPVLYHNNTTRNIASLTIIIDIYLLDQAVENLNLYYNWEKPYFGESRPSIIQDQ